MLLRANKACYKPPPPIATAPIANGFKPGAKVAAVPVVPHKKAAANTAKNPH